MIANDKNIHLRHVRVGRELGDTLENIEKHFRQVADRAVAKSAAAVLASERARCFVRANRQMGVQREPIDEPRSFLRILEYGADAIRDVAIAYAPKDGAALAVALFVQLFGEQHPFEADLGKPFVSIIE